MSINSKINEIGKLLHDPKGYDSSKLYELLDDIGILSDAKDKALSETSNKAALNIGVVIKSAAAVCPKCGNTNDCWYLDDGRIMSCNSCCWIGLTDL